ncbi:hypothetical protein BJX64DRAFT_248498 [Aspergillus heterothallicus]
MHAQWRLSIVWVYPGAIAFLLSRVVEARLGFGVRGPFSFLLLAARQKVGVID